MKSAVLVVFFLVSFVNLHAAIYTRNDRAKDGFQITKNALVPTDNFEKLEKKDSAWKWDWLVCYTQGC